MSSSAEPPAAIGDIVEGGAEGVRGAERIGWPDNATTVMIRNIPGRYQPEDFMGEIHAKGFEGTFDFFYLPVDFITKRTKGYGFVNFGAVEAAEDFVDKFHLHRLSRYPTKKILEVVPAITQGFEANVAQYTRKDRQRIQNPWFRPMVFDLETKNVAATVAAGKPVGAAKKSANDRAYVVRRGDVDVCQSACIGLVIQQKGFVE